MSSPAFRPRSPCRATASNEWAVDGRHTASGAPLLTGDPHLGYSHAGIWYLARLEWPGHVLAGATAPGVPFLVLGHNGRIAWTFTTTGPDTQDVFIETPVGDDQYATPEGPRPFTVRQERVGVRGQPDQTLLIRETRHGPLISDLRPTANGALLAVAMANLAPGDTAASGLLALNRARRRRGGRAGGRGDHRSRCRTCWWPTSGASPSGSPAACRSAARVTGRRR